MTSTNTTWIEEIREAMDSLKKACAKNPSWTNCYECPFDEYCTALQQADLSAPDDKNF